MSTPSLDEYREVTERPLGSGESRVERTERIVPTRDEALWFSGYWKDRETPSGIRGWVECRSVSLWRTLMESLWENFFDGKVSDESL